MTGPHRGVREHLRGNQRALRDLQPRIFVFDVARDVGVPGPEGAEQLFDVRDRALSRSESGEGITTSDDGDEQRQRD